MEHRHSARKPLNQRVLIEAPRSGSLTATARNISVGGMYVETHRASLRTHTQVGISFSLARGTTRYTFCPLAMVVHLHESGIGLMFLEMETDTLRVLSSVLSSPVMIVETFETAPLVYTARRTIERQRAIR
jgi:hypothetical protein